MRWARLRLAISVVLFVGWLGWLGYLAATTTRPVVLSRPQLLVSTFDLIGDVASDDDRQAGKVSVREVHWPAGQHVAGSVITVENLSRCDGWVGPGTYILPLDKHGDSYRVTAIPQSPGFDAYNVCRIYPYGHQTAEQLDRIAKPTR